MSEATLKKKWRRHASKHGIWSKSMSPHQIPGCPDIVAIDCGASEVIRQMGRTRHHWIEAKVVDSGPTAFRASRDATAAQTLWILEMYAFGVSTFWLLLDEKKWMLVPGNRLEITRTEFQRKSVVYGKPPTQLFEPETKRTANLTPMAENIERLRAEVAKMFKSKRKSVKR